jgi:hypothetical protein
VTGTDFVTREYALEIVELVIPGARWGRAGTSFRLIGQAHLEPPDLRPLDLAGLPPGAADRPGVLLGVRLSLEWGPLPARSRYVAALLCLQFHDPRVTAVELRMTPAETSVSVLRPGTFGWSLGDPEGISPIPPSCQAYACVRVPPGVDVLSGTVRVDASIARMGWAGTRRDHARGGHTPEFALCIPREWAAEAEKHVAKRENGQPVSESKPAVRLCVAADTEQYSRFRVPEAVRAQQRFVEALARARRHAGLAEAEIDLQKSGDGQFAVLPPGVDESAVIPKLVEGIKLALAETNSDLSDRARLRLRVALHRGHVRPGMNGWVGAATIAVHRLLDSEVLRRALTAAPDADFALIVSDVLYQDVIADHYGLLDPGEFAEVTATLKAKNFTERAWVHIPGAPKSS